MQMTIDRRDVLKSLAGLTASSVVVTGAGTAAVAQSRSETLRHVLGSHFSSLDPTLQGSTRESSPLSVNIYDRLASFERKKDARGYTFDFDNIRGELAERIDRSSDGLTYTFHIRQGATWHDGTPVEAEDVKWSLDRGVTANSLSKPQLANGSIVKEEQISIVGDRQVQVTVDRPDRLALAVVSVPTVPMFNSKLAKRHATSDDPWAINWLKDNTAAGGAYTVESNRPGQQIVLRRNDKWKNGKDGTLPHFQRIIAQTVPDVSARASLVERGDADLTLDAATSDIIGIEQRGRARVLPIPLSNAFQAIGFNTQKAPFNDVRIRRAIAAALPYEAMFKVALFERGERLFGANWTEPTEARLLQAMPNRTDLDRAKALLAEAGVANGFKTTFSFAASAAPLNEPMAALIKESLAKVGVEVTVQKLPEAQYVTMILERKLDMYFEFATSWFPNAEYVIRTFFMGNGRWNSSAWDDATIVKLAEEARFEVDPAAYNRKVLEIVKRLNEQTPVALVWQPSHDAVVARDVEDYTYWFHRGADYRDLRRA
ncbi:ABC transporter substrate-binding protein [Bosea sp. F3-2]|nr:ABC transporter substrate-binding protein [Bosea sp. F3-2]